jgi:hypothetical protein
MNLPQLDKNLFEMDYVDDLIDTFINQWDMSRFKRRSNRFGLEWWLKETIIFYPTVKLSSNLYIATWTIKSLDIENFVETCSFDSFRISWLILNFMVFFYIYFQISFYFVVEVEFLNYLRFYKSKKKQTLLSLLSEKE